MKGVRNSAGSSGWRWHASHALLPNAVTFQVTHATDDDTNAERDFILGELNLAGAIGVVQMASRWLAARDWSGQPACYRRRGGGSS
jgi:hypothetical protein